MLNVAVVAGARAKNNAEYVNGSRCIFRPGYDLLRISSIIFYPSVICRKMGQSVQRFAPSTADQPQPTVYCEARNRYPSKIMPMRPLNPDGVACTFGQFRVTLKLVESGRTIGA